MVSGFSRTGKREGMAMAKLSELGSVDVSQVFLLKSVSLLASDFLPKIGRCLDHLTEEDVWWRPNEASNSIGNLLLHLRGNVSQWIIGGVGDRRASGTDNRNSTSGPIYPLENCSHN